jgi:hypothetical protein
MTMAGFELPIVQATLDEFGLADGLLHDGQRFDKHGCGFEVGGHGNDPLLVLNDLLRP